MRPWLGVAACVAAGLLAAPARGDGAGAGAGLTGEPPHGEPESMSDRGAVRRRARSRHLRRLRDRRRSRRSRGFRSSRGCARARVPGRRRDQGRRPPGLRRPPKWGRDGIETDRQALARARSGRALERPPAARPRPAQGSGSSPASKATEHVCRHRRASLPRASPGGVAERLNAAVSKTVMGGFPSIEGSNPSPSVFGSERYRVALNETPGGREEVA